MGDGVTLIHAHAGARSITAGAHLAIINLLQAVTAHRAKGSTAHLAHYRHQCVGIKL